MEIAKAVCEDKNSEIPPLYSRYLELTKAKSPDELLIICRELLQVRRCSPELRRLIAIGDGDGAAAGSHGRIAYPKNKFNDAAFERLSLGIRGARAFYTPSINGACEAVAEGSCEFCILPIENSSEGKLVSFYGLLDRFELKICSACDLDTNGDSQIRYALVCRGCREPSERALKSTRYILDFFVLDSQGGTLNSLLEAAGLCGAQLLSIDARPVPYDEQSKKFILSFRISGAQGLLFRAFLALHYDGYSPVGLYPDL